MSIFDLHFHPAFKSYMSGDKPENRKDCWHNFNVLVPNAVDSQSSLQQGTQGGVKIGIASFVALEPPFAYLSMIRKLAPIVTFLNRKMLGLDGATHQNHWEFTEGEIQHLQRSVGLRSEEVQIIKSYDEYNPEKVNLILAIEGAHSFAGKVDGLVKSFETLKTEGLHRFLYITLVHQTQYITANHAYSVKIKANDLEFMPDKKGLTDVGRDLIKTAYDKTKGGHITFVDVKHMSLLARQDFYKFRKSNNYEHIPIIASHAAATGISWAPESIDEYIRRWDPPKANERSKCYRVSYNKPKGIEGMYKDEELAAEFNPWSLNLYNEEIKEIVQSKGLIGLILDRRVLGAEKVAAEHFFHEEFTELELGSKKSDPAPIEIPDDEENEAYEELKADPIERTNARLHIWHLCSQILHIVRYGGEDAEGWDHITLGSDYDGFISPIKSCKSQAEYRFMKKHLIEMLPIALAAAKNFDQYKDYDFKAGEISHRVDGILFENGRRFLEHNFRKDGELIKLEV